MPGPNGRRDIELPQPVRAALRRLGRELRVGSVAPATVAAAVSGFASMAAGKAIGADQAVAAVIGPTGSPASAGGPSGVAALCSSHPLLRWIVLFHRDGRLREMALADLGGPAPNAFLVGALAHRVNDWAEPVRAAARRAADRVFAATAPDLLAEALMDVLERTLSWRRWNGDRPVLAAVVRRPDVAAELAARIRTARVGAPGRVLRAALRDDALDAFLPALAERAASPHVRAVAFRVLIERRTTWRIGWRREWIDRRYGLARRIPVFAERPVVCDVTIRELVERGSADRASAVRRIAADAVIERPTAVEDVRAYAERLLADRNAAVRARGDYLARHLPPPSDAPR